MTKQKSNYTPIECGLQSEYELAIMHKTKSEFIWIDINKTQHSVTAEPIDLLVRDKQEFLKIKTTKNEIIEIRLDKLVQMKRV